MKFCPWRLAFARSHETLSDPDVHKRRDADVEHPASAGRRITGHRCQRAGAAPGGAGLEHQPPVERARFSHVTRLFAGSTERLTLAGCRRRLDRVQHAMARDRVVERGAEMRSLAIVAGETRVRLGDVGRRPRALRRRPPILLWHGQDLERGLRAPAAAYVHWAWPPAAVSCRSPSV